MELILWGVIIAAILVFLYLYYLRVVKKKSYDEIISQTKVYVVVFLIVIVVFLFVYRVIIIEFLEENEGGSFIWTLLNSLLLGMYVVAIGLTMGGRKGILKAIMLVSVVYITLSWGGYIGLRVTINIIIFVEKVFESNTIQGVFFLTWNWYIFIIIFVASNLTESEIKDD
ncbi:MAG: hypothetical protein GF311_26645 [Candidatus Lokiarchaeota archaeon]|nr:hypothetical protein [Candidatus Lokiarchaeota archaeon]